MVPEGWEEGTIADVCDVKGGKRLPKGRFLSSINTGYPYIRVTDMHDGGVDTSNLMYVPEDVVPLIKRYTISCSDLFITVAGTLGVVGEVPEELDGANLTENADKLTNIRIDRRFLLAWLQSPAIQALIKSVQTQNAQPKLAIERIKTLPILIPPDIEQRKIAAILSTWDQAIEKQEALIAAKQQRKRALLQQLLTGKKRFKEFEGQDWKTVKIGSVLREVKRPLEWSDDETYTLLSVKRGSGGVTIRESRKGRAIQTKKMNVAFAGDFLISKMQVVHGAWALVGKEHHGLHISDSYLSLVTRNPSVLDIGYFDWLSRRKELYLKAYLSSYGVHIEKMTFNLKLFLREEINIPGSVNEQRHIVEVLNAADHELEALQKQLAAYKQQKRGLMQQLLTGKKRVRTTELEHV
jgi:type I restriction enzyme, S subunit